MPLTCRTLAGALGAIAVLGSMSCASDDAAPASLDAGTVAAPDPGAFRFDVTGVLEAIPSTKVLVVLLGPRSPEPVQIWLDGDYLDGSLDRDSASLEGGHAEFTLSVPSAATTFAVRARLGEATARLDVSVSASGFATLRVLPKYRGPRKSPSVLAGVFVGRPCAALTQGPLPDGVPHAEGPLGAALVLASVPAAVPLTVLSRVQRYAVGCVEVTPVAANTTTDVDVELYDRPLDLNRPFGVELTVTPSPNELTAWRGAVGPVTTKWLDTFVSEEANEGLWLLDAMAETAATITTTAGAEFSSAREAGSWNDVAKAWLLARPPSVRARANAIAASGMDGPPSPLSLKLHPGPTVGHASIEAHSLAGRPIEREWIHAPAPFDWSADAADVLRISGALMFELGGLLDLGVESGARALASMDFASVLAGEIDCAGLAQALVGSGDSYESCDSTCTTSLCREAIVTRTRASRAAVDAQYGALSLGLTSTATPDVGPNAEVRSFQGTWTGSVQGVPTPFGLHGTTKGTPEP